MRKFCLSELSLFSAPSAWPEGEDKKNVSRRKCVTGTLAYSIGNPSLEIYVLRRCNDAEISRGMVLLPAFLLRRRWESWSLSLGRHVRQHCTDGFA